MGRGWTDTEARNRESDAWAERLELRLHAIALVLTATVLAMRLVAGTQDLVGDESGWNDLETEPSGAGFDSYLLP